MSDGKRYRLKATKTRLYKLAKQFIADIAPMSKTTFYKYPRSRDYVLEFKSGPYYHHIVIMVCAGAPLLGDRRYTYNDDGDREEKWETHKLTVDELRALGMVEEVKL